MQVLKRNGTLEDVSLDKILNRIRLLVNKEPKLNIDYHIIAVETCNKLYNAIPTIELDEYAASLCNSKNTIHPDYDTLAIRIAISNHHKQTSPSFSETVTLLYNEKLLTEQFYNNVMNNRDKLNAAIDCEKDYNFDYFGFKTLERSFLLKCKFIVERPQYMFMRVALAIHGEDIKSAINTYNMMSDKLFIHASPTLYNAGTNNGQLSSCFVLNVEDSIKGIFGTLSECATISKYAGGIGVSFNKVRCAGSTITGTNGRSNGIVPFLRVYNNTAKAVDQGGGKRKGSIVVYIEPWHADIESFLDMKSPQGDQELRCRDLFTALWVNDLFMQRVKDKAMWSLFDPKMCNLTNLYGDEFNKEYIELEAKQLYVKQLSAVSLFDKIVSIQIQSGMPYMTYKDQVNSKNNMQHLGVIQSSNLCAEINIYYDNHETAVCNLASIGLPMFVNTQDNVNTFDFNKLHEVAKVITHNLNKIIDINYYSDTKTYISNLNHRPIGIGIQGLANLFISMGYPFDSKEANNLQTQIIETIYHGAMEMSIELAKTYGYYSSFDDSPLSKGMFQHNLWNIPDSNRYDWDKLRKDVIKYGARNSLLLALMPTASTSQILGFTECFEPITSNIYTRKTLAGSFTIINKQLIRKLIDLGIWNIELKNKIIEHDGSIQNIREIPIHIRKLYKTVWEISQKALIDMSASRAPYICQSQSLNLFLSDPTIVKVQAMHMYAWEKKLKTGLYYLRTKPASAPQKFTIDPSKCTPDCDRCSA